jgi:phosphatidylglycerol lysyltransferase
MELNRLYFRSKNYYIKEVLGCLFILLAIYFFRHETRELASVSTIIGSSDAKWITLGILVTLGYIVSQGVMYYYSFKVLGVVTNLYDCIVLFLKRNFISVFLPGGGITSLAFFSKAIERNDVSKTQVSLASMIYGLVGILTVFIIAIPVMIYLLLTEQHLVGELWAFAGITLLIVLLAAAIFSIIKKGWLYKKIIRYRPDLELIMNDISAGPFSRGSLIMTIVVSLFIELIGIIHLLIAMKALGIAYAPEAAIVGYVIATLFLVISPFLKGLGAVELSLILLLKRYGFSTSEATATTFLYRFFEFWAPLLGGILAFLLNKGNILLRILPVVLLFGLGLVDIASVLTPAIAERVKLLNNFLPAQALQISNQLMLLIGLLQLITSVFLFRSLRNAWYVAIFLCMLSIIGNLTKALDFEEAILAATVLLALILTRRQYYVKSNRDLQNFNLGVALCIFAGVTIYGVAGFYFLDQRHFRIDFSFVQSVTSTFDNFILLNSVGIVPYTKLAHLFLTSINLFGASSIVLVFYAFLKPFLFENDALDHDWQLAKALVVRHGKSPVDYFKTYADKLLYFPTHHEGFIAYRTAGNFAIVLEEPVCAADDAVKLEILKEFEAFCKEQGLKPAYYRVDPGSLPIFEEMGKKNIIIGEEARVELEAFSLEGKDRKSMRNAVNSVLKKGFLIKIYEAPIKEGLLQKLHHVSDNWLKSLEREEMVFSQGLFDAEELKDQTIITVENEDERVVAFLNIIPDYVKNEATYDLIRKTEDAPAGCMDILIIELINYFKAKGFKHVNLGMAPMSGIGEGRNFPEKTMKFAYEKIRQFKHYRGLRDFKEKFDPAWEEKYLVYDTHFDLLQLPAALAKVFKP